jgi:phosphate transport system permease protein
VIKSGSALLARRKRADRIFEFLCLGAVAFGVFLLGVLLYRIFGDGLPRISMDFVKGDLSRRPNRTGIWPAIVGSAYVMILTGLIAVPIGVGAAIYLEEFTLKKNRLTDFVQLNIANLAGVPSIVYGLLGLAVFVRWLQLGTSIIAGALTMSLLILPMIIIVTQESLRAVSRTYRDGSLALGSTQWQAIRYQVIPAALPGIMTGIILAISRAVGETAPLIVVGAAAYLTELPKGLKSNYTVLPMQIFSWAGDAQQDFNRAAAAGIVVLMVALLALNSIAIFLRARATK